MADGATVAAIIADLEARQDEVLRKLEELDQQVEKSLAHWLGVRTASLPATDKLAA